MDLGVGRFAEKLVGAWERQRAWGLVSHFTEFGFYSKASEKSLKGFGSGIWETGKDAERAQWPRVRQWQQR